MATNKAAIDFPVQVSNLDRVLENDDLVKGQVVYYIVERDDTDEGFLWGSNSPASSEEELDEEALQFFADFTTALLQSAPDDAIRKVRLRDVVWDRRIETDGDLADGRVFVRFSLKLEVIDNPGVWIVVLLAIALVGAIGAGVYAIRETRYLVQEVGTQALAFGGLSSTLTRNLVILGAAGGALYLVSKG